MHFRDLWCVLRQDEDEVYRIGPGYRQPFDFLDRIWLICILGRAFQDGFQTGCILKLLVGVGVLVRLQGWDGMVRSQLSTHLREN